MHGDSGSVVLQSMPKMKTATNKLRTWKPADIRKGTRVLLRVDANVPLVDGDVSEGGMLRIRAAIPEILRLQKRGSRIVIATHLGRPMGRHVSALSTSVIANAFARELKHPVRWIAHVTGERAGAAINRLKPGGIAMLENLRFEAGETKNDAAFAKSLSEFVDVFVNNAFGVCHEKHASVHAITKYLPSFAGELLIREIDALSRAPEHPFVLVLGGAKVATKIPLLHRLGKHADAIVIGGGAALTFIAASGGTFGAQAPRFTSADDVAEAKLALRYLGGKIVLPVDLIASKRRREIVDIGPASIRAATDMIGQAKTIVWNGPMGIIEEADGYTGTLGIAWAIASNAAAYSVVGGGETTEFLESWGIADRFSHVSTGGGAMLAFLGGEPMPGLSVLRK